MDRRDLALEAAFTSMSLCERCREPGVEGTLELTSLPSTAEQQVMEATPPNTDSNLNSASFYRTEQLGFILNSE